MKTKQIEKYTIAYSIDKKIYLNFFKNILTMFEN
tara:strand:- start:1827 stop:1928 length:102 start_codon:yes stop_codon:yes gene_type:complete